MQAHNSGPRLRHLGPRRPTAALAVGCVAGALAATGVVYLLLWWADAFPLLPGPPALGPWPRLVSSAVLGPVAAVGLVVALHNQKGRLLRQAERLADGGEQIRAARVLQRATGLGLEECVRAVAAHVAGRPPPPAALPEEVRRL